MSIENDRQLENARQKLRLLEEQYERKQAEPTDDRAVRNINVASLRKTINQFKEEIIRYQRHVASGPR